MSLIDSEFEKSLGGEDNYCELILFSKGITRDFKKILHVWHPHVT